jgi:hypothetical protein
LRAGARRLPLLVAVAAALPLAPCPPDAAGAAPRAGFWESAALTRRGEAASILVRRAGGRTVVTDVSTPSPDCRDVFGNFGDPGYRLPLIPVDRRGRFAAARRIQTEGIAAVHGRFRGRRPPVAALSVRWSAGPCQASARFRLRPVRRAAIPDGEWAGTHADGGGTIAFEVVNTGREAHFFRFAWSPQFRCTDGSAYRYPVWARGTALAWIRPTVASLCATQRTTCC